MTRISNSDELSDGLARSSVLVRLPLEGRREPRKVRSASTGMYVPKIGKRTRTERGDNSVRGFTLLEILIALFIFAILALLLSSALHNVIGVQSRTEQNADRLHETQLALLVMSRDITQAVNRPVVTAASKEEAAFVGKPTGFTFTHAGVSNADGKFLQSGLQRVRYFVDGTTLWRSAWAVLDQAPQSAPSKRALLTKLNGASFEYLDSKRVFHPEWPLQDGPREPLPRAVRIHLDIAKWGMLDQLYVIPVEPSNAANAQPTQQPTQQKQATKPEPEKP